MFGQLEWALSTVEGWLGAEPVIQVPGYTPVSAALPTPTGSEFSIGNILTELVKAGQSIFTTKMQVDLLKEQAKAGKTSNIIQPLLGTTTTSTQDLMKWVLIGGGALAAVLIITRAKGSSPARRRK